MKFFIFLFLSLLFIPKVVLAVGVEVNPAQINILYPDDKETNLAIKNISKEPIFVTVSADHFTKNIEIYPNEFQLLPDENIKLKVNNIFDEEKEGVKNTYISVVSKPLERQSFNAASGIKIPITINISQEKWRWSGYSVFVVSFFFMFLLVVIIHGIMSVFDIRKVKPKWHVNLLIHHKKPWHKRIFRR